MPVQEAAPKTHNQNYIRTARPGPVPGLALAVATIVCAVLGTVLLVVGVFVLREPALSAETSAAVSQELDAPQPSPQPASPETAATPQPPQSTPAENTPAEQDPPAVQQEEPQQQAPAGRPAPRSRAARSQTAGLVKTAVTVAGLLLLAVGAALGIANSLLLRAELEKMQKTIEAQNRQLLQAEERLRDYTPEEKLRRVFDSIPVLEELPVVSAPPADRRTAAYGAAGPAAETAPLAGAYAPAQPGAAPVPSGTFPPAAVPQPQDPLQVGDTAFAAELAGGAQQAMRNLRTDARFEGASINVDICLNSYRAGQEVPYQVQPIAKNAGVPYYVYLHSGSPAALYPNPFAIEKRGFGILQEQQYISKAFRITAFGKELTPAELAGMGSRPIARVQGAELNGQMIVARRGLIELGG